MVLGGSWASYGIKQIPKEGRKIMKTAGFTSRIVVSIIVPLALIIFWILWFFFYAQGFNFYQNLAIFIVSLLAVGGILGGVWAPWSLKHNNDWNCEKHAAAYYHHEKKSDDEIIDIEKKVDEEIDAVSYTHLTLPTN